LVKVRFGWAAPTFAGAYNTHSDVPCWEKIDYPSLKETVLLCERLGFDSVWLCDHVISGVNKEILECWTVLSALASATEKIRLGTLVLCNTFRYPAMLAKMSATFDVVSGGRLEFGYGAGYIKENVSYGLPVVESAAQRIHMMEEGLEIIKRMWTEEKPSFKGRFYEVREALCEPKPLQKPHPPIWIGGGGEKLLLKAVAKYANGWNWGGSVETMVRKMEALRMHCRKTSRQFDEIAKSWDGHVLIAKDHYGLKAILRRVETLNSNYVFKTWGEDRALEAFKATNLYGTPEEVVERIWRYVDIGINLFTVWFLDYPSEEGIKLFAEKVMPLFY